MGGDIPGPTHPRGAAGTRLSDQPTPLVTSFLPPAPCGEGQGFTAGQTSGPILHAISVTWDELLSLSELQFLQLCAENKDLTPREGCRAWTGP